MKNLFFRLIGAAIVAGLALAVTWMSPSVRIAIGILVGLPSFVLMNISRRHLGDSFSVSPKAKALITTGLYSRIQHPMYLFLDLFLLSIIVAIDLPILIIAWAILVIVQTIQSSLEEKVLSAAFGAAYETYRDRTWI